MANLLLSPEDLSTTWFPNNADLSNVNAIAAPDGTTTADILVDNGVGGTGSVFALQSVSIATSTNYVFSCFLKEKDLSWAELEIGNMGSLVTKAYFNLSTGAKGSTPGANVISTDVEAFSSGWYRCSMAFQSDAADGSVQCRVYVQSVDNGSNVDRDSTSSIYVWGAYLNTGLVAETYVSQAGITVTSSTPRLIRGVTRNITRDVTKNLIDF